MQQLHYFNPGHEVAVSSGKPNYTPPAPVRKMTADLQLLPLWYANQGDSLLQTDESIDSSVFLASIPAQLLPAVTPIPLSACKQHPNRFDRPIEAASWGWSPQSIRLFETIRNRQPNLIVPAWDARLTTLTGRQTAAELLSNLQQHLPQFAELTPPQFCTSTDEIRRFIEKYPPPYFLKMPYSCSGRGVYRLDSAPPDNTALQWIAGAIRRQGTVSIEPGLDNRCDFALEFYADGAGSVSYEGLSLFQTSDKGAFGGNLLGSQTVLRQKLAAYINPDQLQPLIDLLESLLAERLGNSYRGYLGVDMLIYHNGKRYAIHPMIELNLRCTIGFVALRISQQLIHPHSSGKLFVGYAPNAYANHIRLTANHPIQLNDRKIISGYFALCPVTPASHYSAFLIAEPH